MNTPATQNRAPSGSATSLLSPRILISFIIVTLIWSSTWIVIRDQLGTVPPSWSVTYRFVLAAITMFIIAAIRREPLVLAPRGIVFAAILGIAQFTLNFNFVYRAEAFVTSGVVAVIFALLIVPNTFLSRLFLGTKFTRQFLAGSVVAILGILLLLLHEAEAVHGNSGTVLLGLALTLCGVMSASTANVMQASPTGKSLPTITVLAWAMAIGALVDAVVALVLVGPPVIETRVSYWAGVAYLGIFGSAISFPLYFNIIRQIGAGPAAWSSVLIPIIAMAISTVVEGYHWAPLSIGGAVLAITGLIIALRPSGK